MFCLKVLNRSKIFCWEFDVGVVVGVGNGFGVYIVVYYGDDYWFRSYWSKSYYEEAVWDVEDTF